MRFLALLLLVGCAYPMLEPGVSQTITQEGAVVNVVVTDYWCDMEGDKPGGYTMLPTGGEPYEVCVSTRTTFPQGTLDRELMHVKAHFTGVEDTVHRDMLERQTPYRSY